MPHHKPPRTLTIAATLLTTLALSAAAHAQTPNTSPPAQPAPSTLTLTLRQPLQSLRASVEALLPRQEDREGAWQPIGDGKRAIKLYWTRAPITLYLQDGHLVARVTVRYRVRVARRVKAPWGKTRWMVLGACGHDEPLRQVTFTLSSALFWTADWSLRGRSSLSSHFHQPCLVSALNINIAPQIKRALEPRLGKAAASVDAFLMKHADLKPTAERLWKTLHQPVPLPQGGGLALSLHPEQLSVTPLSIVDDALVLGVALRARPQLQAPTPAAAKTKTPATPPLPALTITTPADGFEVLVSGQITFAQASALMTAQLAGKPLNLGGHSVTIRQVTISGTPLKTHIDARFDGDATGTLRLTGRPVFDLRDNTLALVDLDYDLSTPNLVLQSQEWLMHDTLRDHIAKRARWDLSATLTRAQTGLRSLLQRTSPSALPIQGDLTSVRLVGITMHQQTFHIAIALKGEASMQVQLLGL